MLVSSTIVAKHVAWSIDCGLRSDRVWKLRPGVGERDARAA